MVEKTPLCNIKTSAFLVFPPIWNVRKKRARNSVIQSASTKIYSARPHIYYLKAQGIAHLIDDFPRKPYRETLIMAPLLTIGKICRRNPSAWQEITTSSIQLLNSHPIFFFFFLCTKEWLLSEIVHYSDIILDIDRLIL